MSASGAIEAVEETTPRPTSGIDVAHNQLESLDRDSPFEWLEAELSQLRYTQLDRWTQQALDEIDVLIVPPALAFRGQSFSFSSDELDKVERFVRDGGSLAVMVRGGVARDIDKLTQRFGYLFRGPPIVFPKGHSTEVSTRKHPLTDGVEAITANLATSIDKIPQHASILASVPEDSPAWFHQDPPLSERSEAEESAAGTPVFTYGQHGDGKVVLLGTHRYLIAPEHTVNPRPLMENLLTVLGEQWIPPNATLRHFLIPIPNSKWSLFLEA